jgi:Polyketide synthase dehydratase
MIVVPGAAYIGMAVEAATQYIEITTEGQISDNTVYTLKNVNMKAAITLPKEDDGADTVFNLRPISTGLSNKIHSFDFRISSFQEDKWRENCTGSIVVEIGADTGKSKVPYIS